MANTKLASGLQGRVKKLLDTKHLKEWGPLAVVLIVLSFSFFHGWYSDLSKPQSGKGWADQGLYVDTVERLVDGELPTAHQLHYAVGYPLLGSVGYLFNSNDPFMPVSLLLFLGSATFCFLAGRRLFGVVWAALFSGLLFFWDGEAVTLHSASEVFSIPWNNQVLFFAFAFYFWLFVTQINKKPSIRLVTVAGLVSGLAFVTREEAILFVAPIMAAFLFMTKADWKKWIVGYSVIVLCFLPQVYVKTRVLGSITSSGRDTGYGQVSNRYLQPDLLYRNTWETIIDSKKFAGEPLHPTIAKHCRTPSVCTVENFRPALFQVAPWLWLSPLGIVLILALKKYPMGLKVFVIASLGLMVFYLSGANMAGAKLRFHCLRYISASFIALNLGVVVVARESLLYVNSAVPARPTKKKSRDK